ncbi:MAG TPA: hypothetical protein VKV15_17735 [Bryobacteraceae bacterium]|nr:hypothetical protein [Bryobacteraceae bacterium]
MNDREGEGADCSTNRDQEAVEDFLRRPSTLPDIGVDLRCFDTEERAKRVGEAVNSLLHIFGRLLNLKRLLRVIVAYDYHETLAAIERGIATEKPLKATNDELAVGIAMAPAVLHEDEPRSIMVLNASFMSVLGEAETPENDAARREMTYTLAHESAHVHDLEMQTRAFPDAMLKTQLPYRDGILFGIASACWDEYIACYLSASFATSATLSAYEETFCKALEGAKGRSDAAIRQYRMHADVGRVAGEVSSEYRRLMVYAAYLLGHVDGLDQAVGDIAPKAIEALERHSFFKTTFSRLHTELRTMHATYGEWKGLEIFDPLKQLADELLKYGGIEVQNRPDGKVYVNIPFRPETTPTADELQAYCMSRLGIVGKQNR